MAKLDVKAIGISLGIVWAAALIIMGLVAMAFPGYAENFVVAIGSKYIGYKSTVLGSLIGGLWGFADAGIGGALIAWIYNKIAK